MTGTRKRYPASFRARVALEAAKQNRTLAELSGRYQVHSVPISQWKKQLLDGIESLFRDGRRRDHDESQAIQAEIYVQAFNGSVALPVVGYDYDSLSGLLLSAGLAPAGMIASFAAPIRPARCQPGLLPRR